PRVGKLRRIVDGNLAGVGHDAVLDRWRCRDQVDVVLAFEPFLDDVEMEQPQEPGSEPEAEGLRVLRLVDERRVIEPQLLERIPKRWILLAEDRKEAGEDHRLRRPVAGERLARGIGRERE